MPIPNTNPPVLSAYEASGYPAWRDRIVRAVGQYPMPAVPTRDLLYAIEHHLGRLAQCYRSLPAEILDIVRLQVSEPTTTEVVVGCELIGAGYDGAAIAVICRCLRNGSTLDQIIEAGLLEESDREAVEEILSGGHS